MTSNDTRSAKIAALNDWARYNLKGCRVYLTAGIAAFPDEEQDLIVAKVRNFSQFTEDNDPYGEHDFGAFDHAGDRIYWKIDYYDAQVENGSPDPTNPKVTTRVLTVLLAEEW